MAINSTKSISEMYDYLKSLAVAVLSTVGENSKPHAAVIYFIADSELHFYFLTKSDTRKSKNLEKHENAALTIFDSQSPKTIQATGQVTEVEDPKMYVAVMNKISEENAKGNNFYWPPPLSKLDSNGDLVLYKFTPDWLRFADFTEDTKESIFYDVIPQS